jgi:hypothetical protein
MFKSLQTKLITISGMEDYVEQYHKITSSIPDRTYIDVCGEKILVTRSDGIKSPVIAHVMSTEHKILDIIDPDSFKEVLLIIRKSWIVVKKELDYKYNNCMVEKMKLLQIDPKINNILSLPLYNKQTNELLDPTKIYTITDNDYKIIMETRDIHVAHINIEDNRVLIKCDFRSEEIKSDQEYIYIPSCEQYIGCNCDDDIHVHKIINNVIEIIKYHPTPQWNLWTEIPVTTKI